MMKKSTMKVATSLKNLPSIRPKIVRTHSSKKKVSTSINKGISLSPKVNEIKINPREDFQKTELFVHQEAENHSKKKMKKLLDIIKDQDEYIESIENQLKSQNKDFDVKSFTQVKFESSVEFTDSSQSKIEDLPDYLELYRQKQAAVNSFIRQQQTRNQIKDKEIEKLKKEIEEGNRIIEENKKKLQKFCGKLKKCEETSENLKIMEKNLVEIKNGHQVEMIKISSLVESKKNDVFLKMNEIEEFSELLKKSEEKRLNINKFKSFIETNTSVYVERIQVLQKEKHQIQLEIQEVRLKIKNQQKIIDQLLNKLNDIQSKADNLKSQNIELNFKLEAGEEDLQKLHQKNENLNLEFESDIKALQTLLTPSPNDSEEKVLIRRATISSKLTNSEPIDSMVEFIQNSYFFLQQQLNQAKDSLEKLRKNENYLKSQYQTKDLLIKQMEKLISSPEEEQKKSKPEEATRARDFHLKALLGLIDEIRLNYKEKEDYFKCVSCFKVPVSIFILTPCNHLYCKECKGLVVNLCVKCGINVEASVTSFEVNKLIKYLKRSADGFTKMKKILGIELV